MQLKKIDVRRTALRDMSDMTIDLLPPDVKTDIFSRLSLDSIIQYRLLCKTWRTLIDKLLHDPSFIGKHTHRLLSSPASYSTSFLARENCYNLCSQSHIGDDHNDNHWSIVGSCNGLVCLATNSKSLEDHNVYICNPLTREYVNLLPQSNHYLNKEWTQWTRQQVVATGFGYHPCTKEYKFVRITRYMELNYVSVYTLGSGRWSTKEVGSVRIPPYTLGSGKLKFRNKRTGLLFNGVFYWSVSPNGSIISFELDTEEFIFVPAPTPAQQPEESIVDELGVLDGCFCLIRTQNMDGSKDIWVRNKEEYEEEIYTWTKKFRIKPVKGYQIERAITAFVLYENILSSYFYMKLDSYDSNTRSLNHLIDKYTIDFQIVDNRCEILPYMSRCEMIPYMMSLVSLKALGESSHFAPRSERKRNREEEIAI